MSQQQEHATDRPSLGSPRPGGAKLTYLFYQHNSPLSSVCPARLAGFAGKSDVLAQPCFSSCIAHVRSLTCTCLANDSSMMRRVIAPTSLSQISFSHVCTQGPSITSYTRTVSLIERGGIVFPEASLYISRSLFTFQYNNTNQIVDIYQKFLWLYIASIIF